jgi:hypothetical protein
MAAMNPVFPMIGLEYRYSVPPSAKGIYRFPLLYTSRQADSTAHSSRRRRAGDHFKKPLINPKVYLQKHTKTATGSFRGNTQHKAEYSTNYHL